MIQQQQNSAFTGDAPSTSVVNNRSQNEQNKREGKKYDMGPSSGDILNQTEENHSGANDQQVDDKLGKGGYSTAIEKEEISSVGISKF